LTSSSEAFCQTEQQGQTVVLQIVDTFVLVVSIADRFGIARDFVDVVAGRTAAADGGSLGIVVGLSSVWFVSLTEGGHLVYVAG